MERLKLNIVWPIMLLVLGVLFSCSGSEDSPINAVKNYDKDRDVLSHFLEIDTSSLGFYLNLSPTSKHFGNIPEHVLRDVKTVSEVSIKRYREEIDEMNRSIQEGLPKTGYLELSTLYDRYFKKVTNSVGIEVTPYETTSILKKGEPGKLLGTVSFDMNHASKSCTFFGKDKVVSVTNLTYQKGGFCEVDISCVGGGYVGDHATVAKIIRAANVRNQPSEHVHYWTNDYDKGSNNTRWKFYVMTLQPEIFGNGTVKFYENGSPYPRPRPEPSPFSVYLVRAPGNLFVCNIQNPAPNTQYTWKITGDVDVVAQHNTSCVIHPRSIDSAVEIRIYVGEKLMYRNDFYRYRW